jgi:hypothetical protein
VCDIQARDKFIADCACYEKFGVAVAEMKWGGRSQMNLLDHTQEIVNIGKVSKFEMFIIMIGYHNMSKNKLKALQKAELEFSSTKMLPATAVHPKLWERAQAIKNGKK